MVPCYLGHGVRVRPCPSSRSSPILSFVYTLLFSLSLWTLCPSSPPQSSVLPPSSVVGRRVGPRSHCLFCQTVAPNSRAPMWKPRAQFILQRQVSVSSSWALSWVFLAFSDKHWPSTPPSLDVSLTLSIYVQYLSASITFPAKL